MKKLTNKRYKIILSRLPVATKIAISHTPDKQAQISKTVKKIFDEHGKDISALARS